MRIQSKSVMIALFFIMYGFCFSAMEVVDSENDKKEFKSPKKPYLNIPISGFGESTSRSATTRTSRSEGKTTPRTYQELEALVKRKSNKSPLITSISPRAQLSPQHSADDVSSEISLKDIQENVDKFVVEKLMKKIHIDHKVMAEGALRTHKEPTKSPLSEEKKGYKRACESDAEYDHLAHELLKRILLQHIVGEENLPPSEKFVDTHVGILRNTVKEKNTEIWLTRGLAVFKLCWAVATTIWGAYLQYQRNVAGASECSNSTMS